MHNNKSEKKTNIKINQYANTGSVLKVDFVSKSSLSYPLNELD